MIEIKAELLPLQGKYYGTEILVNGVKLKFWETCGDHPDSYIPSDRELANHNMTRGQWDNNEPVKFTCPFDGQLDEDYARELLPACDHFEDQYSYMLAKSIVDKLNGV